MEKLAICLAIIIIILICIIIGVLLTAFIWSKYVEYKWLQKRNAHRVKFGLPKLKEYGQRN